MIFSKLFVKILCLKFFLVNLTLVHCFRFIKIFEPDEEVYLFLL